MRCLLGHKWRELPWFKPLDGDPITNPTKICMRCFKMRRKHYALIVRTIEGHGWRYYLPPHWEGQSVPDGYESWDEYRVRMERAAREIGRKAR